MKKKLQDQIDTLESVYKTINEGVNKIFIKSIIRELKEVVELL